MTANRRDAPEVCFWISWSTVWCSFGSRPARQGLVATRAIKATARFARRKAKRIDDHFDDVGRGSMGRRRPRGRPRSRDRTPSRRLRRCGLQAPAQDRDHVRADQGLGTTSPCATTVAPTPPSLQCATPQLSYSGCDQCVRTVMCTNLRHNRPSNGECRGGRRCHPPNAFDRIWRPLTKRVDGSGT